MSQYATLLAHSRRLGAKPILSSGMEYFLKETFPNISIHSPSSDCDWNWTPMNLDEVHDLDKSDFEEKNIMIGDYVFDVNAFNFYQNNIIREELTFDPDVRADAEHFLKGIKNSWMENKEVYKF